MINGELEDINAVLRTLNSVEPIISYSDPKTKPQHLEALAKMYGDEGYRDMLINAYNDAIKATALKSASEVDQAAGKMRALTFKELLVKSKHAFEDAQKLVELRNKRNA